MILLIAYLTLLERKILRLYKSVKVLIK